VDAILQLELASTPRIVPADLAGLGMDAVIIEKDFWVCWTLMRASDF
jgi:hypothetical protein